MFVLISPPPPDNPIQLTWLLSLLSSLLYISSLALSTFSLLSALFSVLPSSPGHPWRLFTALMGQWERVKEEGVWGGTHGGRESDDWVLSGVVKQRDWSIPKPHGQGSMLGAQQVMSVGSAFPCKCVKYPMDSNIQAVFIKSECTLILIPHTDRDFSHRLYGRFYGLMSSERTRGAVQVPPWSTVAAVGIVCEQFQIKNGDITAGGQ